MSSCLSEGFERGQLACRDCVFDTSDCNKCGDDEINVGEACDTMNLDGKDCRDVGFIEGPLSWGEDLSNQVTIPMRGLNAKRISAGFNHTCIRDLMEHAQCWGDDTDGKATPPPALTFKEISVGKTSSCGIDLTKKVHCWGSADKDPNFQSNVSFDSIDVGYRHACGTTPGGDVLCWDDVSFSTSILLLPR